MTQQKYDPKVIAKILEDAAALLCNGGWCQYAFGLAADGSLTDSECINAVRLCARSAIAKVAGNRSPEFNLATRALLSHIYPGVEIHTGIIEWNDRQNHVAPVIAAFLDTAKELRKRTLPLYV